MKKAIIVAFSFVFLTGCSFIDNILNPPQEELVEQIDEVIKTEKDNDKILKDADIYGGGNTFKNFPTPTEAQQTLQLIKDSQSKVDDYQEAIEEVGDQIDDLDSLAREIRDDDLRRLAEDTLEKLAESVKVEKELIDTIEQMNKLNETFYGAYATGSKPQPDNYGTVKNKRDELRKELNDLYKEIDKVWFKFFEEVTGQKPSKSGSNL